MRYEIHKFGGRNPLCENIIANVGYAMYIISYALVIHWCCAQTNKYESPVFKLFFKISSIENYHLYGSIIPMDSSNGYHQEQNTRCMKFYMPNIMFLDERESELRYLVPLDQPHLLARLFDQLDSNIGVMGIASYGLSACSMEQVFVALNEECSDVSTDGKCL